MGRILWRVKQQANRTLLLRRFLLAIPAVGVLLLAGCGSNNNVNVGFNRTDAKNAANAAINTAQNTGSRTQNAVASAVNGFNATPTPSR